LGNKLKHIFFVFTVLLFVGIGTSSCFLSKNGTKNTKKQEIENTNRLIDAKKEQSLGNTEDAKTLFAICIKKDSKNAVAMYELANILIEEKNFEDAVVLAEEAAEISPENKWYQLQKAEIYTATHEYDKAAKIYKKLVEQQPEYIDYYYEWARIYILDLQYVKSIEVYNLLEKQIGVTEEISIQKHKIYLYLKDYEKAINEIKNLIEVFPSETRYWGILADLYTNLGKGTLALEAYNKIIEIDPDEANVHLSLANYYKSIGNKEKYLEEIKLAFENQELNIDSKIQIMMGYYSVNDAFENEEIKAEAFMLLQILVETHPDEAKSHSMYADFLYQNEEYRTATEELKEVIALDSTKYLVWEEYLLCWLNLESYDTLQINVEKTLEFFPEQAMVYLISAIAFIQEEEYEKAIEKLNTGSYFVGSEKKLSNDFNSMLGDAYHHTGEDALSDKHYDKVLEKQPLNLHVLNKYSYNLSLRGERLDDAEMMIKKVLGYKPNNPQYLDTYAWILYKKQKYEEAEEAILKAIDNFDEEIASIFEHYGDILYQLNKKEQAVEYWIKAKELGEENELLDKKIKDKKLYE